MRRVERQASWILAALVLALAPAAAVGLDDGGGRSVFAYGAGNRALALGGAYVAVPGDASTPLWNPGGLGLVERRQFQAAHTNLIGLGFGEQYASLVLPSWRWGVASVTFRHFGVGGIEHRDERNVLLAADLSDSESEIALGYGRRLGRAWSVGGVVKMQRHSLAGLSGSGVGLDLGVLLKPLVVLGSGAGAAERLNLGLAVRNAVQPSIKLDTEAVPDPTGVRVGLAYDRPFLKQGSLLATVDLEKTSDMNTRLHTGLELRVVSLLAVRGGLNNGTLTAGTGVRWRDIAVDYAFEDNVLSNVHRIGVSLAFGPTTTESRGAALAAEEAEIQARLTQAFDERNRRRIEGLIGQARAALDAGRPDEALEILAMVAVLAPAHDQLRLLQAAAYRERGLQQEEAGDLSAATVDLGRAVSLAPDDQVATEGLARVRAASDRQTARTSEIRQLLDQALDAFAADDLLAARAGFQRVLEVDPEDQEAAAMLRRAERALRNRAAALIQQASASIQNGRFDDAEQALDQARRLDSGTPGLNEAADLLSSRRGAAARTAGLRERPPAAVSAAPATAAPARQPLSPERRREVADLYRRGMEAMEDGRVDDAIRYWEIVWSADPEYQSVAEFLKREYLTRGMEAFASGELQAAVSDWEKVLRLDQDDQRARGYLERAQRQLNRIQEIVDERQ